MLYMHVIDAPLYTLQCYITVKLSLTFVPLGDKTPAKEHAAVWVPDSEAQYCMHCLKAKFTTMNRRVKYSYSYCTTCNYQLIHCDPVIYANRNQN